MGPASKQPTSPEARDELAMAKTLLVTGTESSNQSRGQRDDDIRPEPRWIVWLERFDRHVAGRRRAVAAVAIAAASICGSLADWLRSSSEPVFRVMATNLLLLVLWVIVFAWLGSLRSANARTEGRPLLSRLEAMGRGLVEDLATLPQRAPKQRWTAMGSYGVGVGCVLLLFDALATLGTVLVGSGTAPQLPQQYLGWAGIACCVLGTAPWFGAGMRSANFSAQAAPVCNKIRELPAILELATLSEKPLDQSDPLSQTLVALSQWSKRKRRQYPDEFAYREALARHFRQHLGQHACRRELWLGSKRSDGVADLVLGRLVLVKVCRGFDRATAERSASELNQLARTWRGKPKLFLVFDVERRELLTSTAMPSLQSLHETAELVTVRM